MFDFFKKKTIEEKMDIIKTSYEKQQESMVESKSTGKKYIWVEGFKGTQENMCCTVTYMYKVEGILSFARKLAEECTEG